MLHIVNPNMNLKSGGIISTSMTHLGNYHNKLVWQGQGGDKQPFLNHASAETHNTQPVTDPMEVGGETIMTSAGPTRCYLWLMHTARDRDRTGTGTRNDGFLYYVMYCTNYTDIGTGTGNHCFLLFAFRSLSLSLSWSQSRAVCMNHYPPIYRLICRLVNMDWIYVFILRSLDDLSIDQHFHDVVNKPAMWGDWESHELSKDTEIYPLCRLICVYAL